MHTVISLVTAAAFAAHVVLGCCIHHTHVHAASHDASAEGVLHRHAQHVHSHAHASGHSQEPGHQPDSEAPSVPDCEAAGCSFMSVSKVATPGQDFDGSLSDVVVNATGAGSLLGPDAWRRISLSSHVHPPSLRRHLECCVLLI